MNKSRSRAYNRDVSKRKALRKKRLAEEVYYNGKDLVKGSYIDNSTDPPTYYPGDLITAERIKALGTAISS